MQGCVCCCSWRVCGSLVPHLARQRTLDHPRRGRLQILERAHSRSGWARGGALASRLPQAPQTPPASPEHTSYVCRAAMFAVSELSAARAAGGELGAAVGLRSPTLALTCDAMGGASGRRAALQAKMCHLVAFFPARRDIHPFLIAARLARWRGVRTREDTPVQSCSCSDFGRCRPNLALC